MTGTTKQLTTMRALTICAIGIALLSFFLPYVSVLFGSFTPSGLEIIIEAIDCAEFPMLLLVICPVLCVIGIICTLSSKESKSALIAVIVVLSVGLVISVIAMADNDADIINYLKYAAVGFYLYEVMSIIAIVLSAISLSRYSEEKYTTLTTAIKSSVHTIGTTLSDASANYIEKIKCPNPNCGAKVEKNSSFCRFCGTPIGTRPAPAPAPAPSFVSAPKPGRNAICPHCGARQSEDNIRCKYCGTPMSGR